MSVEGMLMVLGLKMAVLLESCVFLKVFCGFQFGTCVVFCESCGLKCSGDQ
jgi:hypothetical protein